MRRRGFTLVEMLVVITVIVLLMAALFPVFTQTWRSVRRGQCLANIRQIGVALHDYQAAYQGRMPPLDGRNSTNPCPWSAKTAERADPLKYLNPNLRSESFAVLQCPADCYTDPAQETTFFEQKGTSYLYAAAIAGGSTTIDARRTAYCLEGMGIGRVVTGEMYTSGSTVAVRNNALSGYGDKTVRTVSGGAFVYSPASGQSVKLIDDWTSGSRKVFVVDWDIANTGTGSTNSNTLAASSDDRPNKGCWHDYPFVRDPSAPTDVSKMKVKIHAGFLDGHAAPIEVPLYASPPSSGSGLSIDDQGLVTVTRDYY